MKEGNAERSMYKLVIIDDEKIICNFLKRLIAWDELGLSFAGMAHDGDSALDLIRETDPDIVIIDIRIPGMDGIEVIEEAQKLSAKTRFLVVSGYQEFDYARQACFLNVANYLVKPIDEEELNASLRQICEEKNAALIGREEMRSMKQTISDQRAHILRIMLEDMKSGRADKEKRIGALQSQGLVFDRKWYSVLIIKFDIRYEMLEQCRTIIEYVRHLFEGTEDTPVRYSCVEEGSRLAVIIGHEEETVSGLMEKIIIANEYVKTYQYCSVSFGLCCGADTPEQFPARYYEAYSASELRRLRYNNVVRYDRTLPRIDYFRTYEKRIPEAVERAVSQGDFGHLQKFLDDSYNMLAEKHAEYCYPSFLIRVFEGFRDIISESCRSEFEKSIDRLIWSADNEAKMYKIRHVLEVSFREIFGKYLTRKLKEENYHITQAQNYIEKHYMEEISMQSVADIVHLHPVYFSNLFKNVTGMNYLDYLQKIRIDHARKKLISSSATIEQIANEVGYQDKRHFSRIFKRIVGMNPGTYRKLYSHHVEG